MSTPQRSPHMGNKQGKHRQRPTLTYFEHARCHVSIPSRPHLLYELCVGLCDLALHAQGVVSVELSLVLILQEVVGQGCGVAQALRESMITSQGPVPVSSTGPRTLPTVRHSPPSPQGGPPAAAGKWPWRSSYLKHLRGRLPEGKPVYPEYLTVSIQQKIVIL